MGADQSEEWREMLRNQDISVRRMTRTLISLLLLSLLASQVDAGKKPLPYPWNIYFWLIFAAVFFVIPCCIPFCCASQNTANERAYQEEQRVAMTTNPSWQRQQWKIHLSEVNETKPSTLEKNGGPEEEDHLLPQERVTVQLVDEQLVDLEVPPAELTLTSFSKLLSDLTFYSGVPDIQGLLVKSESGGFVQVFDMGRIPKENFKVRAVISGTKHFLRLYPNTKLEE